MDAPWVWWCRVANHPMRNILSSAVTKILVTSGKVGLDLEIGPSSHSTGSGRATNSAPVGDGGAAKVAISEARVIGVIGVLSRLISLDRTIVFDDR